MPGGLSGGQFIFPIGVFLAGVAPVLIYGMKMGIASSWLIGGVVGLQVGAIVWLPTRRLPNWCRAVLVVAALAAVASLVLVLGLQVRSVGLALGGVCHAAAYGGLLTWFVRSLRPGREPAVTGFARRMRRTMPAKVVQYTRWVTMAWCGFFALQLAGSAALLVLAPEAVWAFFINLLNLPLIAAMILAEFGVRLFLFRREPRTGLIATVTGLRHLRGMPDSRS